MAEHEMLLNWQQVYKLNIYFHTEFKLLVKREIKWGRYEGKNGRYEYPVSEEGEI